MASGDVVIGYLLLRGAAVAADKLRGRRPARTRRSTRARSPRRSSSPTTVLPGVAARSARMRRGGRPTTLMDAARRGVLTGRVPGPAGRDRPAPGSVARGARPAGERGRRPAALYRCAQHEPADQRALRPRHTDDLIAFLTASPSPYHAVASAAERLEKAGFRQVEETDAWDGRAGREVPAARRRDHRLVRAGGRRRRATPFRIVGAHTDSPNLRVKPLPGHRLARLAAGRRGDLRRRAAQHLARPRPRARRPARAARRPTAPGRTRPRRCCGCRSWRSTSTAQVNDEA